MNTFFTKVMLTAGIFIQSISFSFGIEFPQGVQTLIKKREEAVMKIDKIFIQELEKMKTNYTKDGDLENANLVAGLIKKTKEHDSKDTFDIDGEWRYRMGTAAVSVVRKFKGNKMIDEKGSEWDWKLDDSGITIDFKNNTFERLNLDPNDHDVLRGVSSYKGGTSVIYTRER